MKKIGLCMLMAFAVSQGVMAGIVVENLGSSRESCVVSNVEVDVGDVIVAIGSRGDVDISGSDLGSAAGTWSGVVNNGGKIGRSIVSFNYLTIAKAGTITKLSSLGDSFETMGFVLISSDMAGGSLIFLGSNGATPASGSTVAVNFNTDGLTDASGKVAGVLITSGEKEGNPLWVSRTGDADTLLYDVSAGARAAAYEVTADGSWDYGVTTGVDGAVGYMTLAFGEVVQEPDTLGFVIGGAAGAVFFIRRRL